MKTLAETILELSTEHVKNGGLIMGQNLEAVQNVNGTVPVGEPGVEIMPTCETAGIGMAVGAALTGRPTMHVIRFQSFMFLQSSPLVFYTARAKMQWGYDLPLLVRAVAMDDGGPVHSGVYHSPFVHMPGLKVVAPMTPQEYRDVWTEWQETKQPVLVSEHRRSYSNCLEMPPTSNSTSPDVLILAISASRFDALDALPILQKENIAAEVYPIWNLRPNDSDIAKLVSKARENVLIVDSGYTPCSVSEHIAYLLYKFSIDELNISVMGMKEPPGVYEKGSPTAQQIADAAIELVE